MGTIRGHVAVIKWSYYNAAAVEGYAVVRDDGGVWTATGAIVPGAADAYKLAQRPLYFVAPHKGGAWRWVIDSLTVDRGRFTARLGPMITEGANGIIARPTART